MVRVNIINPRLLADQHLMAEHLEIIMLVEYARRHPSTDKIPQRYCLGTGHILFFKNKIKYLQKRDKKIQEEMKRRGFKPKTKLNIKGIKKNLLKDWAPLPGDRDIIRKRILWKIKHKPNYYRYYGEKKPLSFFLKLISRA